MTSPLTAVPLPQRWEDALTAHRERHLGPAVGVFAELVPDLVHVDLWPHVPREGRGVTLVTQGASARPVVGADGAPVRLEVFTYVDERFLTGTGVSQDERYWWPARMLKQVARFPHEQDVALVAGHTLAFDDPPAPLLEGSLLTSVFLMTPLEDPGFEVAEVDGEQVHYAWVLPLTTAELQLKLEQGAGVLLEVLSAAGLEMICDPWRACAVTGRRPSVR